MAYNKGRRQRERETGRAEALPAVLKADEITKGSGEAVKKQLLSICLAAVLFCLVPCYACALNRAEAGLVLPAALTEIGEEAFSGSPAESVWLPDGVTVIGARAFAACKSLRAIRIPASVVSIADSAFDGCAASLTVYGKTGSEAQRFAERMNLSFRTEDSGDYELPEL